MKYIYVDMCTTESYTNVLQKLDLLLQSSPAISSYAAAMHNEEYSEQYKAFNDVSVLYT